MLHLRRAIELAPEDGRVHLAWVTALWGAGDVSSTDRACDDALKVAPEIAELWLYDGYCKAALGRFAEAAACYRKAIDLEPDLEAPRYALIRVGHQAELQSDAARLLSVLEDPAKGESERITAGYALGELFDRAGDYDAAWSAFATANRLAHASDRAAGRAFDPVALDAYCATTIANFRPETFLATAGRGDPSEMPVFVVGMPRSGTSLVEQIASSHPQVFGAGELHDIPAIVSRFETGSTELRPTAWDPTAIADEAAAYLQKLGDLGRSATRVIDKMPENFQFLGHIAVLFPRARIIICRRDLRDVGLSCYQRHFGDKLSWSTGLADSASRAQGFEQLVSHWRAVLPLAILEVQYEDLVDNLELESRRLIEFFGLEWDPACLAFHETERPVMTASMWQVRQPLFTSSVGRWLHYRRHLQPLLAGLAGLIPSEGDEDWDSLAAEPATALAIAVPLHRAGRLDHAELIYSALLRRNPDDPAVLHLLGVLRLNRDDPAGSVALITRSLALRPAVAPVLASLSRAHRAAGNTTAAIEAAQRAVVAGPALPDPLVQLGHALLAQRDYASAAEVLRRATAMAPDLLEAWVTLAAALTLLKDAESAARAWQAALALKPNDVELLIDFAGSLVELQRHDEALATYQQAASLAPDNARAQYGFARYLLHVGNATAAADTCRRSLETAPDVPRMWLLLANCESMRGRFDAAADAYRRALELEPGLIDAIHNAVSIGQFFGDNATKRAIQDTLEDQSRAMGDRVAAGFALGQLCDRSGAYDEAFETYAIANRLLRDDRAAHGYVFDRNRFPGALVDRLIAAIDAHTFSATVGWGDQSELPVFIVGMPRSGTSLVEQIAASHPLVFGAGEQNEVLRLVAELDDGQGLCRAPVTWDQRSVRHEASSYIQHLSGLGGDAVRIIDKQPDNILCLGQNRRKLFPPRAVVVCRRDLRDVGLSCFFPSMPSRGRVSVDPLTSRIARSARARLSA